MAEMAAAAAAMHLGARHEERPVGRGADRIRQRLPEARPAGAAVVFGVGREQRQVAARAGEVPLRFSWLSGLVPAARCRACAARRIAPGVSRRAPLLVALLDLEFRRRRRVARRAPVASRESIATVPAVPSNSARRVIMTTPSCPTAPRAADRGRNSSGRIYSATRSSCSNPGDNPRPCRTCRLDDLGLDRRGSNFASTGFLGLLRELLLLIVVIEDRRCDTCRRGRRTAGPSPADRCCARTRRAASRSSPCGIVDDLHRLGVAGAAAGDLLVGRVRRLAADIAGGRGDHARPCRNRPPRTRSSRPRRSPSRSSSCADGAERGGRQADRQQAKSCEAYGRPPRLAGGDPSATSYYDSRPNGVQLRSRSRESGVTRRLARPFLRP